MDQFFLVPFPQHLRWLLVNAIFFWVVKPTSKWQNGSRTYLCWINLNCHCWSRILFAHVQVLHQLHISHEFMKKSHEILRVLFTFPYFPILLKQSPLFPVYFGAISPFFPVTSPFCPRCCGRCAALRGSSPAPTPLGWDRDELDTYWDIMDIIYLVVRNR